MLKKILSATVALAMCLALSTAMPLANAAEITGFDGSGTAESPYLIRSAADLQKLAETVNDGNDCSGLYFRLENDIDLSDICGKDIGGEDVSWTPVGINSKGGTAFSGTFGGDGHEISGLYINAPSYLDQYSSYTGLFGYVGEEGIVENLRVSGNIEGYEYIGSIVGINYGTVDTCCSSATVSGYSITGGVVGMNYGTVYTCSNSGTVSGDGTIGGVVGGNFGSGTIDTCSNSGTVSGNDSIGGIVGSCNADSSVYNCSNFGTVSGNSEVGGIAGGKSNNGTVYNCSNTDSGTVSGDKNIGGVVGQNLSSSTVGNCSNSGTVSGNSAVGGIVGYNIYRGIADNCSNSGTISGSEYVGGIVGHNDRSTVDNCSNIGMVLGENAVSGIVGFNASSTTKNCYNFGYIECTNPIKDKNRVEIGGVVGCLNNSTMQNCYNYGEVYCTGSYVGGVAGHIFVSSKVLNCYNIGKVSGDSEVGGVVGRTADIGVSFSDPGYNTVQNCYNIGEVSGESDIGGVAGYIDPTSTSENCYYLIGTAPIEIGNKNTEDVECRRPESSFTSGEIAYILQGVQEEDGLVWGQRLTTEGEHDGSPVLTSNEAYRVLKATFIYDDSSAVKYANPNTEFTPPTEDLPKPPEGYILGWTKTQGGETAEFYDTVTIEYEDTTFYAVVVPVPEPEPQDPEFDPPKAIEGLVYDRTEQKLIEPGSAENGTMVYSFFENEGYSEDIPVSTDAGEYTVWYKVVGDEGYNDTEPQSLTVKIAKADPKPDIPELTAVKGQTLADVELPEGFAWVDETLSVGDVGENSFAATFTPKDTKNFNTLENLMLTVKVTEPEQEPRPEPQDPGFDPPKAREGLVYDRTEQELITAGSAKGGTMVYSLFEDGDYSDDIPVGTDAGKYTVWYKVIGDEGYNDTVPRSLTAEIAKADPVPPETDLTATVGQTLADIEQQLPEGYAWVDRTQSVGEAGENAFPATFAPNDTKNYNVLSLMLTVRVTEPEQEPQPEPQDPEFTPPMAREGLVYDRTEQELITAGSAKGGTMVYKLEEEPETVDYDLLPDDDGYSAGIPVGTDAGKYTVWYKVIGDEGYNDTEPKSLIVEIAKADPVPPETDLTATVGQTLADVELPEGFAWVDDTQSVGNVGTNYFPAIFTPADTKNFNTLECDLPVKVTKPEEPAETTTTTAEAVTTTTAAASEATATTTAAAEATTTAATVPETTAAQTEVTTTTATAAPEVTTEPPSTTSPPPDVTETEDEDKIPNTGVILIAAPFAASAITVVVSRKRK